MEVHLIVVQQTPGSLWHYLLHSRVKVPREADNGAQIHLFHQRVWPWQARPQSDTHSHILWSSFWIFTTRICNRGTQRMGRVGWTSHRKLTWQSCTQPHTHNCHFEEKEEKYIIEQKEEWQGRGNRRGEVAHLHTTLQPLLPRQRQADSLPTAWWEE